jgi:hypothetical protein
VRPSTALGATLFPRTATRGVAVAGQAGKLVRWRQGRKAIDAARLVVGFVKSRLSCMFGEEIRTQRSSDFVQTSRLKLTQLYSVDTAT